MAMASSGKQVRSIEQLFRGVLGGLLVALIASGLLGPLPALGAGTPDFQVVMVSPQRFRIQPLISGPVSSSIIGGGGNQTLITRQENGHTIIDAEVPLGATLRLQVGSRSMKLQMVDSQHYQCWED
jgi:hypothetical protein